MNKVEELKAIYLKEQSEPIKATKSTDVPRNYSDITPEWFTNILCKDVLGAEVLSFSQGEKDDGSSNRRRIFLRYNEVGQKAGLPKTVFCKATEKLENRLMLGLAGTSQAEVNFFNKVRDRLDIEAPHAYHAAFDPSSYAYIVVFKDIADEVDFCDERTDITWDRAVNLVTLLATFHSRFYESPDLGKEPLPFEDWPRFWNNMLEHSKGWETACEHAFELSENVIPERLYARRSEIWGATLASIMRHNELARTLLHCDVHLKNWYITKENKMGLADWQILTVGHWSRDLIYAITTALSVEDRRSWGTKLIQIYLDKMEELGVPHISIDEAMLNCRQQLFSALAFWTITLVPAPDMPPMQPERTTYKFIERFAAAIDDLDALDSFK